MTPGVIEDEDVCTTMDVASTDGFRQNISSRHIGPVAIHGRPPYFGGNEINVRFGPAGDASSRVDFPPAPLTEARANCADEEGADSP